MDLKFKKPFLIFSLFICLFLSLSDASTKRLLERYCTLQYDDDTKFYDLRSLSLRSEHLTVKNETDTYFVNICSTTNAFKSANQKPLCVSSTSNPTSICLVNSGKPDEGIEIAHLHSGKLQVENGSLFMRFRNPDEDEAKKLDASCVEINTTILFSCAKSRPNELPPVLTKRSKCAFEFEWKSSEACVDQHTIIEPHQKNDSLIFLVNGTKVDLSEIMKPQAIKVEYQNNGKPSSYDFVIRINELKQYTEQSTVNLTGCNDSFVCQVDASSNFTRVIANLKNNQLKHANGEFHLVTSSESKCGRDMTKNTSAIFNFYCNTTQVDGNIAFVAENNLCHYIFNLTHPKVCEYEALFDGPSKNDEVKPVTDKPKTDSTTVSPPTTPATVKPDPGKKNESSPTIDPPSSSKISPDENNSNTTAFGLVILALVTIVGIVLVFFALINDDRRSWLQKRLRRVINPQTTTSFSYSHGYSQVHNSDSSRLVPLDSVTDE